MNSNYYFRTLVYGGMGFGDTIGEWTAGLPNKEDFPWWGGVQIKETVFLQEYGKEVVVNDWEFNRWEQFMEIFKNT